MMSSQCWHLVSKPSNSSWVRPGPRKESSCSSLLNGLLWPFQLDRHLGMVLWSIAVDIHLGEYYCNALSLLLNHLLYFGSVLLQVWLHQALSTWVSNNNCNLLSDTNGILENILVAPPTYGGYAQGTLGNHLKFNRTGLIDVSRSSPKYPHLCVEQQATYSPLYGPHVSKTIATSLWVPCG